MNLMVCMRGESKQIKLLPEIEQLNAGIELGSYGMVGVTSDMEWKNRYLMHKAVAEKFHGKLAIHGPFIGIDYSALDYMLLAVVQKRLDMTFEIAKELNIFRVVLHSGFKAEMELFKLQEYWLQRTSDFWKKEIIRWEDANIEVVLENEIEKDPDLLIDLIDEVNSSCLGICFDIGHQNIFSEKIAYDWIKKIGSRLKHVHLHDNDGERDCHWRIGKGKIDFNQFFSSILKYAPTSIISLEINDTDDIRMYDLRELSKRFHN